MPSLPNNFGLLEPEESDYATSRVAVLPVPFERTTSYGKGTTGGPAGILRASQSMELWDEELQSEPYRLGIATLPAFLPEAFDMAEALAELREECRTHLANGKFLVTLGGEHSLTQAPVLATREVHGEIGVVQFDAHSDLREEFEGTPYSHASVMKRIVDAGIPTLAVGIRSLSSPEACGPGRAADPAARTARTAVQDTANPEKATKNKRRRTAKPAAFDAVDKKPATGVGAPSYTSGAQKWNGTSEAL